MLLEILNVCFFREHFPQSINCSSLRMEQTVSLSSLYPCLFPDSSVAVSRTSLLFPMDLRVGERGMRPGSDTVLLTPLHPPLHLSPFSPQPRSSFSQQQLHQQIRVRGKKLSKTIKDFLGKLLYNIFYYTAVLPDFLLYKCC